FEPSSQRSISRLTTARLVPNLERPTGEADRYDALFDHLPADTLLAVFEGGRLIEKADEQFAHARDAYEALVRDGRADGLAPPERRYLDGARLEAALLAHARLLFGAFPGASADETLSLDARPQPSFNSSVAVLRKQIRENHRQQIDTLMLSDSRGQETRLFELLEEDVREGRLRLAVESLHEGFEVPGLGLAVYTDHQIFNRYHRPSTRRQKRRYGGLSLREIQNLSIGDFVVHVDYGIGKFARSEEHTSELQSRENLVCRLLLEKKKKKKGGSLLHD